MHNVHITPALSDASRAMCLSHSGYYSQDGSLPIYDRYVCRVRYYTSVYVMWTNDWNFLYTYIAYTPPTTIRYHQHHHVEKLLPLHPHTHTHKAHI